MSHSALDWDNARLYRGEDGSDIDRRWHLAVPARLGPCTSQLVLKALRVEFADVEALQIEVVPTTCGSPGRISLEHADRREVELATVRNRIDATVEPIRESEVSEAAGRDLTGWEKILLAEYAEVCKSHSGITDFRAKLLALLPLASGAGVGLLVGHGNGHYSRTEAELLIGLGVFGAVVTAGLFFYELRQIDVCKQLRNHAAWIEHALGIIDGHFGGRRARLSLRDVYWPRAHKKRDKEFSDAENEGRPKKKPSEETRIPWRKPLVGAEAAGYIVYHSVILAWVLVVVLGLSKLDNGGPSRSSSSSSTSSSTASP